MVAGSLRRPYRKVCGRERSKVESCTSFYSARALSRSRSRASARVDPDSDLDTLSRAWVARVSPGRAFSLVTQA